MEEWEWWEWGSWDCELVGGGVGLVEVGIMGGGVFCLQHLPPYFGIMSVGLLSGHPAIPYSVLIHTWLILLLTPL